MKLLIRYADAAGVTDGVTQGQLIDHLPQTENINEADAIVIVAVCHPNFKFNHGLNELVGKKPIIIIDYLEYGWQWSHDKNNVLGEEYCIPCTMPDCHDWGTLNQFVAMAGPVLQFKRELRRDDVRDNVIPIDFLAHLPKQKLDTRDEYNNRPFDLFNSWGYSHPDRARVHGDIFHAMGNRGINVLSNWDQLGGNSHTFPARSWISIFVPHWVRKPMSEVLGVQSKSKISLSLYGAGWKCFRSVEAPENCVMAQQKNDLAWAFPFDESNSIRLDTGKEVEQLIEATHRNDLYDLYLASQDNIDKYRRHRYINEYILPNIQRLL